MAKYWEDEQYYPVRVTAISQNNTAVVLFKDYGNHEEVFLDDIVPYPTSGGNGRNHGWGGGGGAAGSAPHPNESGSNKQQPAAGTRFIPTTPGLPPAFPQTC